MEMVIKESMRLHSTVPFIGRKVSQDIHFGKIFIIGIIITYRIVCSAVDFLLKVVVISRKSGAYGLRADVYLLRVENFIIHKKS